MFILFCKIINV